MVAVGDCGGSHLVVAVAAVAAAAVVVVVVGVVVVVLIWVSGAVRFSIAYVPTSCLLSVCRAIMKHPPPSFACPG